MASGLATRCPACGTVFRVVLDQLRVSEGWVRCGRCSDVFNAGQALVDLESGATRRLVFETPPGEPAPPAPPAAHGQDTVAELDEPPVIENAEPPFDIVADEAEAPAQADAPSDEPPAPPPVQMPSFVRRAEQAQRWRQPRVRAALAGLGVLAALALAAQVTYTFRDLIAAGIPSLRGTLVAGCDALGCSVGPPHAIEHVSVESSGLVRVEKSSLYRLAVALRNRAGFDVALPALEVSVSDGQGKLLARRVLRPAEMGASQLALGAGRDLLLQATLQIATEPVAGYSVEIFYPRDY
jgi:predicted Zn finger-like uncharacterized protein